MCKHIYNPENTYEIGTPFTYLISWSELNISYYGVRYSKDCHPDDLWTNYFTSSPSLWQFRIDNGEPDIVIVDFTYDSGDEARLGEYQFIKENNCVRDSKWLNLGNGGEDFCCTGHSEESKQIMSKDNKGRIFVNNGEIQKLIKPEYLQDYLDLGWEQKKLPLSEIHKQRKSETMKGRITINNGFKEKLIKPELLLDYLDLGWFLGPLPKSKETIQKQIESMKGRITNGLKKSEEFKLKCSLRMIGNNKAKGYNHSLEVKENQSIRMQGNKLNSGKIWINNGIINKILKPEDAEIFYQQGYVDGMIQKRKI